MTTKNNNITILWESCLPILGPSPDCVRDAHVRWISTATTSNGLDKRGWLSKQMLADVGRCWQMLAGSPNQGQEFAKMQLDSKDSSGASVVHRRLL